MTNEEWIRMASKEELAEFIDKPPCFACVKHGIKGPCYMDECLGGHRDWLKEEHEDERI